MSAQALAFGNSLFLRGAGDEIGPMPLERRQACGERIVFKENGFLCIPPGFEPLGNNMRFLTFQHSVTHILSDDCESRRTTLATARYCQLVPRPVEAEDSSRYGMNLQR